MSMQESIQENKATLLLVDDEQNILSALKRLFRPLGYNVLTAEGGAAALEILEQNPVDLVISDMRMPEMDGAELLARVAERWPQIVRILLTGFADLTSTIKAVNEGSIYKYISKPWEDSDIKLTVQHALDTKFLQAERDRLQRLTQRQNEELKDLNANLEKKVDERTEELRDAHDSLRKSYFSSIKTLSNLIELREGAVSGHSKRIAEQARKAALGLGLDKEETQQIFFAALLHDIGKMGLPDELMKRPPSSLTAEERRMVAKHTVLGEALLMGFEPLRHAARLIRSHHEYLDGSGYPDGISGADIPLGARILTAVNDYDDLLQGRLGSRRMNEVEARDFMVRNGGRRYDQKVIEILFPKRPDEEASQPLKVPAVRIDYSELKPGMVLAKDLVTRHGLLILSEGYILDEHLIGKIHKFAETSGEKLDIRITMKRIR